MKENEPLQLVICDMAGTTVRDEHEVESCFTKAAMKTKLKMTYAEILSVQGWSKKHVFEVFWERQVGVRNGEWIHQVDHSYTIFKQILEDHYYTHPIYPTKGCQELFDFLKDQHIGIALTTGFYRNVTNIILEKLGWLQGLDKNYIGNKNTIIQASIASDEVNLGRPAPDMILQAMELMHIINKKNVINIGDTPSDIQSGFNAECRFSCCVINGTHSKEQLAKYNPDHYFNSLSHFRDWLKENV